MPSNRRLVTLLRGIVVVLSAQFLLGIWVNLFGAFPPTHDVATAVLYGGDPVLTAHYALAVLLVALAIAVVLVSFREEGRTYLPWLAVAGLLSILWASASGIQFVLSGFSDNVDSFSMAAAFIAATSFYGVAQALVLPGSPPAAPSSGEGRQSRTPGGPAH